MSLTRRKELIDRANVALSAAQAAVQTASARSTAAVRASLLIACVVIGALLVGQTRLLVPLLAAQVFCLLYQHVAVWWGRKQYRAFMVLARAAYEEAKALGADA